MLAKCMLMIVSVFISVCVCILQRLSAHANLVIAGMTVNDNNNIFVLIFNLTYRRVITSII